MRLWQLAFVGILASVLQAPSAWAGAEEAEVQQMFQECVASGGRAATNYNDWVAQNGCLCPGQSTGSGNRTCSGSTADPTAPKGLVHQSSDALVKGVMNNNAQETGVGIIGLGAAILIDGLTPDPAAEAERERAEAQREAAAAAENQRQAEEAARQADASKARLLGQDGDKSGDLHLMDVTGDPSLAPMAGNAPLANASHGMPSGRSDAYTKGLQDASECFSQSAGAYCGALPADRLQVCVDDYHAGYAAGSKQQKLKLDAAVRQGLLDQQSGKPNGGFNDPRADGGCRIEWIDSYNSGYSNKNHR